LLLLGAACSAESPSSDDRGTAGTTGSGVAGSAGTPAASGGGSSAGQSNPGGTSSTAGSGGAGTTGGSSTGGGGSGGTNGASGSAGQAGGGAPGSGGTGQPGPTIMIDPARTDRKDINFSPTDADPTAKTWHGAQRATFDGSKKAQGKLIVTMGGIGNGPHTGGIYQYAAGRGFHMFAVDMYNSEGGESNQGKVYLESFSGQDLTPVADVSPPNSVMGRIKSALAFLNNEDPGAAWGFFLDAQGEVRWDEVMLFGYSYGGQVALAATKFVAPYRTFLTASPTLPNDAAWLNGMPNVADVNKCFALNSSGDEAKFAKLMTAGWPGTPQVVMDGAYNMIIQPPFMGSSMLQAPGGHTEFCSVAGARYDVICDFVFDVKK
jgi:hypothetical protein